jgi:CheY-like chemotaxis protein
MTRPVSLLDILGLLSGEVEPNQDGWQDAEVTVLNADHPLEILVADDAQTNRIILTELLRDAGHNVVCVENGIEMVARMKDTFECAPGTRPFDIILTDVQMPLLDGLNATSQIRALEQEHGVKSRIPIVAVTAHAMTEETSRMRQFGVDDVVTKPLDPIKLGEVIQKLTGKGSKAAQTSSRSALPLMSSSQLAELGLRLWTQLARRDSEVSEIFELTNNGSSPEDFQRVLDIMDIIDRSGDSVRRSLLIFRGFLDCFRQQLQSLNDAKQEMNLDELRFASHALKGLLMDVGARTSGELASLIEQLCKVGKTQEAAAHVSKLVKQVLLVSRLISQIAEAADSENAGNPLPPISTEMM